MSADTELFPGFATRRIATSGAEIHCVVGGSGSGSRHSPRPAAFASASCAISAGSFSKRR